jgi:adenylate kinase family enzyme
MSLSKIAVIASASGNGKTTLGRAIAQRLGVPFIEMDALVHGPAWRETPNDELRARIEPVVASAGWVIDGSYRGKLGDLILDAADIVVWLDLPMRVWLPRLLRRTARRIRGDEELWNGNKETLRSAFFGRDALLLFALRTHFRRRREYPRVLASRQVARLRTRSEVDRFLRDLPVEAHAITLGSPVDGHPAA